MPMKRIHELFETQVEHTPDAVAIVFGETELTYRELHQRAERLADRLRVLGVGPDVLVALFLERSLDMVVSMLGVLKAGGAYIPLDPSHPTKRLAYMLADARPLVLLTHARLRSELPPHSSNVLVIDAEMLPAAALERAPAPVGSRGPRDLAYVIFTSGSTGEPKGVEIEHRSVVNMLEAVRRRPGLVATDTMLAITTLTFDIAALELFLPLVCGARVVIADSETVADGEALTRFIKQSGVSVMQTTPATLRMLLDSGWAGDPGLKILCGGEAWTAELADQLLSRCGSLWNMYGPTETTVWSAISRVEAGRPIVIGQPIANTRLYVLSGGLQLLPVGVPGELFIAGEGLARGYLRRPELSRERFVTDPFAAEPGARMYRTGDKVRRLSNGTLEFLGRLDHQVKIRGHRVELGEIEARLVEPHGIREAVVLAREDTPGEKRLVAYFTGEADIGALRTYLLAALPEYMVPAAYVHLDALPLTPNGKTDRGAFPAPGVQSFGTRNYEAPEGPAETAIAAIWTKVLQIERVGRHDSFFEVGGHSLLALRVIGEINTTLSAHLTVSTFFQQPTISGLATALPSISQAPLQAKIVSLNSGQTGLPVYFIGARPEEYSVMRLLSRDRPTFAIDAPFPIEWHRAIAAADRAAMPTIEQLSSLYCDELRKHARSKPCVVAGYSLGGKIAFETAHALQRTGGNVALVLIVDARAVTLSGGTRGPALHSFRWIWRGAVTAAHDESSLLTRMTATLSDSWRLLLWLIARLPRALEGRISSIRSRFSPVLRPTGYYDGEGTPIDQAAIDILASVAGKAWHPRPINAPGVMFRARVQNEELLPGNDFTNGWSGLFAQGLEIIDAEGDHSSIVAGQNAAALVRQINAVLERYEPVLKIDAA